MAGCGDRAAALLAAACKDSDVLLPVPLPHTRALRQKQHRKACSISAGHPSMCCSAAAHVPIPSLVAGQCMSCADMHSSMLVLVPVATGSLLMKACWRFMQRKTPLKQARGKPLSHCVMPQSFCFEASDTTAKLSFVGCFVSVHLGCG